MELDAVSNLKQSLVEINKLAADMNLTLMDSILYYCERNGIEVEAIGSVIKSHPSMKAQLEVEAEELHFLPKKSRLPI